MTSLPVKRQSPSLIPATRQHLSQLRAILLGSFKIPSGNVIADPAAHVDAIISSVAERGYPNVVLLEAYRRIYAVARWMPAGADLIQLCETILKEMKERAHKELQDEQHNRWERERRAKLATARAAFEKSWPGDGPLFDAAAKTMAHFGNYRFDEWFNGVTAGRSWAHAAIQYVLEKDRSWLHGVPLERWISELLMLSPD